jgi:hypothetical protein
MPRFVPGLELGRRFYYEAVRPALDRRFADLAHAAALIGPGSEVLGFDTEMSTDHDWGLKAFVFVREQDTSVIEQAHDHLRHELPHVFLGYPVGEVTGPDGVVVDHRVVVVTLREFIWHQLAYDVRQPPGVADWLTFPSEKLLEITSGAVYHDGVGELTALRACLAYYPRDVWLYLLAAGWERIGQEEHLMPRAGYVGDELGSALIGSRLVRDVMNLCFLMERRYAPYPKWFGSAFRKLACAQDLLPVLWAAQRSETWREREGALIRAYECIAQMHNALDITEPLPVTSSGFHDRPFRVIHGGAFAEAIRARIADPEVVRIASRRLIGGIDQFSDNTDLHWAAWRKALLTLYAEAN